MTMDHSVKAVHSVKMRLGKIREALYCAYHPLHLCMNYMPLFSIIVEWAKQMLTVWKVSITSTHCLLCSRVGWKAKFACVALKRGSAPVDSPVLLRD